VTTSTSRTRSRLRARGTALAVAFGTLALGFGIVTQPVGAASTTPTSGATPSGPTITVTSAPAAVAPGADVHFHVALTGSTAGMLLRVSAHPAITSRTAFSDTIAGNGTTKVLDDVSLAVAFMPRASNGDTIVPFGLQDPDGQRNSQRLDVEHSGVYPLTISLSPPNADPVASVSTWLVVAERPIASRLSFAWVWQLVNTPLTTKNRTAVQAAIDPGGRLARAVQAVDEAGTVPVSLVLGPETFATWAEIAKHNPNAAAGLSEMRDALVDSTTRQILATPYVPLDVPSLEAAGLAGDVISDLRIGSDTVRSVLGVVPDPRTVMVDPVDGGALAIARNAFAQRIVVREKSVVPVAHELTPARPFGIASGGRVTSATASNDFVDQLLSSPGSRAERAQRFLAGLSVIALEAPSSPRGIVVATPSDWNPDPALIAMVLAGLRDNPFIRPTTLDGYFTTAPSDTNSNGTPLVTTLTPFRPAPPTVTAAQIAAANQSLASFRSLVGNNDRRVVDGAHAILIAPSSALDSTAAATELAGIDGAARQFLSSISTSSRTITLTSRTARIPLSFVNGTGQKIRVKVHLASTKLTFPEGAEEVLVLPPHNTTSRFLVAARTSGTFTMRVTLTTADDQFTISTTLMTVRSTVFSSIGVLLTVGALLFLAIWWGNHIRRSRRQRRTALVAEPA
jgi:Family of unknown function (DUF6049)